MELTTAETLELVQFVDISDIPPIYYDRPYFLAPTDDLAEDAFRVVRDALKQTGKAGIARVVIQTKQHLAALIPLGPVLVLNLLRWGDEIAAGKGPPSQWERHVVGATLLLVVAALSMTATARGKTSGAPPPPSTLALVVSAGCAAAALGITLWLRSTALSRELGHVLLGGGWLWMLSGTALALGSTSFALIVRLQGTRAAPGSNKRVKRKRV